MKIIPLLFAFITFASSSYAQQTTDEPCTVFLSKISKEWRADSLTDNGFRRSIVSQLTQCSLNDLELASLILYLGNPSKTRKFKTGVNGGHVEYIYYVWDIYTLSNKEEMIQHYVSFVIDEKLSKVLSIQSGIFCG